MTLVLLTPRRTHSLRSDESRVVADLSLVGVGGLLASAGLAVGGESADREVT